METIRNRKLSHLAFISSTRLLRSSASSDGAVTPWIRLWPRSLIVRCKSRWLSISRCSSYRCKSIWMKNEYVRVVHRKTMAKSKFPLESTGYCHCQLGRSEQITLVVKIKKKIPYYTKKAWYTTKHHQLHTTSFLMMIIWYDSNKILF